MVHEMFFQLLDVGYDVEDSYSADIKLVIEMMRFPDKTVRDYIKAFGRYEVSSDEDGDGTSDDE